METFSALLAFCAGNSLVIGKLPARRPVTWSFDGCFVLRLNKQWSKQSWGQWLGTLSRSLWRQCNLGRRRLPWHLQCSISGYNFPLTYRGLENVAILHDNCSILINIPLKIVTNHPSIKKSALVLIMVWQMVINAELECLSSKHKLLELSRNIGHYLADADQFTDA